MMSEQLDWTQKLGDAVLAQQADVMDTIQRLRTRARANGKLESTKEQTVTVKTEDQKQYVVIEPASPTQIYVPYYEPAVVYGDWPYPDYAPYYFPPPPATSPAACSQQASSSQRPWPFAMPSGATATGAVATSTSRPTDPLISETSIAGSGNTTRITDRV